MLRLTLGYGRRPLEADFPRGGEVVEAATLGPAPPITTLLDQALDRPIASRRLEELVRPGARVLVIVSDPTRDDPRAALLAAVLARLPGSARVTLAVASGTHGPCDPAGLELPPAPAALPLLNHDGHDRGALVTLGTTSRGTPIAVHRAVVEADLVVATGAIRPHYFAGFSAGIKAVFPGLGGATEIRINHRLKQAATARAGVTVGNPCREDLDEVAGFLPRPVFLLNAVADQDGVARAAVAGDVVAAFHAGAAQCGAMYRVRARPRRAVVVSDRGPVTASLYQASKLVAAAAALVAPGGTIVIVAGCEDGIGPVEVVNQAIYEIGLRPRLPTVHRVLLVSELPAELVRRSYAEPAISLAAALAECDEPPLILPRAAGLLVEVRDGD